MANSGTIIQYNYNLEESTKGDINASKGSGASMDYGVWLLPKIGFKWKYYPAVPEGPQQRFYTTVTQGEVISINEESGVVVTNAGEILIRG